MLLYATELICFYFGFDFPCLPLCTVYKSIVVFMILNAKLIITNKLRDYHVLWKLWFFGWVFKQKRNNVSIIIGTYKLIWTMLDHFRLFCNEIVLFLLQRKRYFLFRYHVKLSSNYEIIVHCSWVKNYWIIGCDYANKIVARHFLYIGTLKSSLSFLLIAPKFNSSMVKSCPAFVDSLLE